MSKNWNILSNYKHCINPNLQDSLNIDAITSNLLSIRGINDYDAAHKFFRPALEHLHNPFLMHQMEDAINRINTSISHNEKVLIYGDYDVDGTTAVAIVFHFFKNYISQIQYYIPDRYKEGYGISFQAIDFAKQNNYTLIIALDCGIKALDKINYANTLGIDFIICDHHLPGNELPKAVAILDPKKQQCEYPFKELSGAGIGFKLIQAFCIKNNIAVENCYSYLDLVTASIASDIVPIYDENRVLAFEGLKLINTNPRPAVKALLNLPLKKGDVNISTLVFSLGPKINAAGRIEHASKAVELLICDTDNEAAEMALSLNETNTIRKDLDLGTTTDAITMLETDLNSVNKKTTVLFNPNWHKGVVGIVASRLIEKHYKPTIILTQNDNKISGSARSVKDFDIYSAIEKCSDLLEQFGGHKFAAGLTLSKENLEPFIVKFEEVVSATILPLQLIPQIDIDSEIEFHQITPKLIRLLNQFGPHGPQNMTPLFLSRNVYDTGWAKIFGDNHLQLELYQNSNPSIRLSAIGFGKGDFIPLFQQKRQVDIVFKIQNSEYRNVSTLQLVIEDVKVA
ncbi:MAG: single-stranded-DNA-specific exonuclease RecJ [Bacteroidetes bacterium]|nr:single-stranded-DNA-specific exonuclease RecJ [Bacteroidota bacterium]